MLWFVFNMLLIWGVWNWVCLDGWAAVSSLQVWRTVRSVSRLISVCLLVLWLVRFSCVWRSCRFSLRFVLWSLFHLLLPENFSIDRVQWVRGWRPLLVLLLIFICDGNNTGYTFLTWHNYDRWLQISFTFWNTIPYYGKNKYNYCLMLGQRTGKINVFQNGQLR